MATLYKQYFALAAFIFAVGAVACNKGISSAATTSSATISTVTASATSSTITVSASLTSTSSSSSSASGTSDSILIIQPCGNGNYRDSIDSASLPTDITTYLTTNYSGFTFAKGFVVKDSAGTIQGYAVVIYFNNKPVGLLFDASGNFVKVLEQRQPGDMDGPGWHDGGRFGDRGKPHGDSVALSSLPTAIATYISTNYPSDTLLKAFINIDSSYLVITADNGLYATLFTYSGTFVKRVALPTGPEQPQGIAQTALPAAVLTYLTTTYSNYVFDKAFSLSSAGTVQAYVVIIDANSTKYAIVFDASGVFVAAKTIY